MMSRLFLIFQILTFFIAVRADDKPVVNVGSKIFTEGYILAEIISQVIEENGELRVNRKFGLGATGIIYEALAHGSVDIYPEYSGTVSEAVLKDPSLVKISAIKKALAPLHIEMSNSLGFNNTYAVATRLDFATQNHLRDISDIKKLNASVAGFSNEFMTREDGFPGLTKRYKLAFSQVRSLEHSLTYEALDKKQIDFTDVYSTDAKISKLHLKVLDDDLGFFPKYDAVILARVEFVKKYPKTWSALRELEDSISNDQMIALNSMVDIDHKTFADAAAAFLMKKHPVVSKSQAEFLEVKKRTKEHLFLVGVSLLISIFIGVPLGIIATRFRLLGQFILLISGLLQTIPSLALLSFLIPLFGIGQLPALVALCLYGLLPIVVGTFLGLTTIEPRLKESAQALGFTRMQRLRLVELPLASRNILSGIKTSMIISIGTATLAALIGAGGYGAPIITGLAINDTRTILVGAVPAALMALVAQKLFDVIDWLVISRGLRD